MRGGPTCAAFWPFKMSLKCSVTIFVFAEVLAEQWALPRYWSVGGQMAWGGQSRLPAVSPYPRHEA